MDGPAVPAVPDDCAGSVRIRGLKAFAAAVSAEPFAPVPADHQYHDGDGLMLLPAGGGGGGGGSYRESRSEYSEASTGSGSHLMMPHDSTRAFELALRPSGPSSQHSGRAPPGMGGGGIVGPGGERATRSLSGPGPMGGGGGGGGGYFGSGSSLGAGSEGGDGWRVSKGSGPGEFLF